MTKKCELCQRKIREVREKECDESGFAWHCYCFRCYICGTLLNEKNVNVRGENYNQLFCQSHALYEKGHQPVCKVYFIPTAYRMVF